MGWKLIEKNEVLELLKWDLGINAHKLLKGDKLLINSSMPMEINAVSNELYKAFEHMKKKGLQPLFIGESVCDTKNLRTARLNLQFAYKAAMLDMPRAYIKPKAEQLFLYTRDVISDSVIKIEGEVRQKGIILVLNKDCEFLGLGLSRGELLGKGKTTVIKHVIDIGHYLRCER